MNAEDLMHKKRGRCVKRAKQHKKGKKGKCLRWAKKK